MTVMVCVGLRASLNFDAYNSLSIALIGAAPALLFYGLNVALSSAFRRVEDPRIPTVLLLIFTSAAPLIAGALDWWAIRGDMPAVTPVLMLGAAALVAFGIWREWLRSERLGLALIGVAGWYWLYELTDTFVVVRPDTEWMHLVFYLGTWGATLAFVFLTPTAEGRSPILRSLAMLGVGFCLLECDQRILKELYHPLHLWWVFWGGFALLVGAGGLISSLVFRERAPGRTLSLGLAATALVLVVVAGLTAWSAVHHLANRAELAKHTLGQSVVSLVDVDVVVDDLGPIAGSDGSDKRTSKGPAVSYARPLNMILISVDALRWDVFEAPYDKRHSRLRELRDRSVHYRRAYAQGSRTAIGMGSLMLGQYSDSIDWRLLVYRKGRLFDPDQPTPELKKILAGPHAYTTVPKWEKARTLAERLKAAGYYTMAAPFAGKNRFFESGVGYDRGFDDFADLTTMRWRVPTSDNVLRIARAQIEVARAQSKPWFQWIHLYDPHRWRRDRKDYERLVGYVDREIGRFHKWLEDTHQLDNTVIALIADHGEAFGEHGHERHGTSLYEEQIRVPLLLSVPGVRPQTVETPVSAIDLTATLLALAGADTSRLDGHQLIGDALAEREPPLRPVFTDLHRYLSRKKKRTKDLKAVIEYPHKLILDRRRRTAQLFDLEADPDELTNIIGENKRTHYRLRLLLQKQLRKSRKMKGKVKGKGKRKRKRKGKRKGKRKAKQKAKKTP